MDAVPASRRSVMSTVAITLRVMECVLSKCWWCVLVRAVLCVCRNFASLVVGLRFALIIPCVPIDAAHDRRAIGLGGVPGAYLGAIILQRCDVSEKQHACWVASWHIVHRLP